MIFLILVSQSKPNNPQYLCQIRSDLHQAFRKSFWWYPRMIQHYNIGPPIQVSIQEPSTSSKYDCNLDMLLFLLGSWKSAYNSIYIYWGSMISKNTQELTRSTKLPVRYCQCLPHITVFLTHFYWCFGAEN